MATVFFFKPDDPEVGFLCQWYPSQFKDDNGKIFRHAEQYMMYHKAMTFNDIAIASQIMKESDARKCKALGRKVKGFHAVVWDPVKQSVVERGNYLKFTNGIQTDKDELKRQLLATGDAELIEASKYDRIWGVGYDAQMCREEWCTRDLWGQNLLGKALINVRKQIREEEEAKAAG